MEQNNTQNTDVQDNTQPTQTEVKEPEAPKQADEGKKYTDEDVNRIIDAKWKKWEERQAKKQAEAKKLEGLSDVEKAEKLRKQAEDHANELQAELDKVQMRQTTSKMLSEASLPVSDSIISMITTGEAETTKQNVDALVAYGKQIAEVVKREYLRGNGNVSRSGNSIQGTNSNLGAKIAELANKQEKRDNPYFKK